ncbi:hypothetical protein CCYA_CCYA03G1125 [Cyanidiococcus yangmingshanensis]|nr:hypothetical protein CCYA_CCYA03G1125 [Cyanidiococcus yangmingshanensis]
MDVFFDPPLVEFVKELRAHRHEESSFVQLQLERLRRECEDRDFDRKTWALLKLTHLQQHLLVGDLPFAAFPIVETAARPVLWQKRVGLLAASLSLNDHTPVMLLLANQLRKDLGSGGRNEQALALAGVAGFASRDLAEALWPDVAALLASARPYLRKRAVIALNRCIRECPEALPACWTRFVGLLEDADPSVVCAAVTIALEEIHTYPELFVKVTPRFYQLLSQGGSNWVLIKVLMILDALCDHEPRLPRKLAPLVANMMEATRAKSLVFECSRVACRRLLDHEQVLHAAINHLIVFLQGSDQNLRYLALNVLRNIGEHCPTMLTERHIELVVAQLLNSDIHIRRAALQLLTSTVRSRSTFRSLVKKLEPLLWRSDSESAVGDHASVEMLLFRPFLFTELWNCMQAVFPDWSASLTASDATWLLEAIISPALTSTPPLDPENLERYGFLLWKLVRFHEAIWEAALELSRRVVDGSAELLDKVRKQAALRTCIWMLGALCERTRGTDEAFKDVDRLVELLRPVDSSDARGIASEQIATLQTTALRALIAIIRQRSGDLSRETVKRLEQVLPMSASALEEYTRLRRILQDREMTLNGSTQPSLRLASSLLAEARTLPGLQEVELAEPWLHPADWSKSQQQQQQIPANGESDLLLPVAEPPKMKTAFRADTAEQPTRTPMTPTIPTFDGQDNELGLWPKSGNARIAASTNETASGAGSSAGPTSEPGRLIFYLNETETSNHPDGKLLLESVHPEAASNHSALAWSSTPSIGPIETPVTSFGDHYRNNSRAAPESDSLIRFDVPYAEIGPRGPPSSAKPENTETYPTTMISAITVDTTRASDASSPTSQVRAAPPQRQQETSSESLLL